ncbi:MAG: pantoate--beta-alanine ligase [Planctomycetes bacterium]|nr:pantoate--beta-alanine ligase [Planctomycetota bacterium]
MADASGGFISPEFVGRDRICGPGSLYTTSRHLLLETPVPPLAADRRPPLVVTEQINQTRQIVWQAQRRGSKVGFVPTMGALHVGHLSLIQAAREECDFVVVSIFVNPTQFGPQEDLTKYPRPLAHDLKLCEEAGVNVVFHPTVETMYPTGFQTFVEVGEVSEVLEGKCRPGHFRGVATVVLKLFHAVPADFAYFGQKDYQQQAIIRQMCRDLDVPIEIRVCPTVREPDGLALSSRNVYLNSEERRSALALHRSLQLAKKLISAGHTDLTAIRAEMFAELTKTPRVRAEYATLIHPETLEEVPELQPRLVGVVAARVGATRLIDNLIIEA